MLDLIRSFVPPLTTAKHKGEMGRLAIIGGSREYTGAPYFAAMSALCCGADIVHIICAGAAAPIIKMYSPELIVHPDLDSNVEEAKKWLNRAHAALLGPGLGLSENIPNATELLCYCCEQCKPLVIDADGLSIITRNPQLVQNKKCVILTPNVVEFERLCNAVALGGVTIVRKGPSDVISNGEMTIVCEEDGSPRRCGGQGLALVYSVDGLSQSKGTRRAPHNAIEKRYRASINGRIDELRKILIPDPDCDAKLNKSAVLRQAIDHIRDLERKNEMLRAEIDALRAIQSNNLSKSSHSSPESGISSFEPSPSSSTFASMEFGHLTPSSTGTSCGSLFQTSMGSANGAIPCDGTDIPTETPDTCLAPWSFYSGLYQQPHLLDSVAAPAVMIHGNLDADIVTKPVYSSLNDPDTNHSTFVFGEQPITGNTKYVLTNSRPCLTSAPTDSSKFCWSGSDMVPNANVGNRYKRSLVPMELSEICSSQDPNRLMVGAVRGIYGSFVCFEKFTNCDFLFSDWSCCASARGAEFSVCSNGRTIRLHTRVRSISSNDNTLYFCSSNGTLFVLSKHTLEIKSLPCAQALEVGCSGLTAYCIAGDSELFEIKTEECDPIVLLHVPRNPSFKVKSVACGSEFILCLTRTGQVFSKGIGSRGQLGLADLEDRPYFTIISALETLTVTAVSAGKWHSACITDTGDLYTWGWNEFGQLGHRSLSLLKKSGAAVSDSATAVSVLALPKPVDFPSDTCVVQVTSESPSSRHLLSTFASFTFASVPSWLVLLVYVLQWIVALCLCLWACRKSPGSSAYSQLDTYVPGTLKRSAFTHWEKAMDAIHRASWSPANSRLRLYLSTVGAPISSHSVATSMNLVNALFCRFRRFFSWGTLAMKTVYFALTRFLPLARLMFSQHKATGLSSIPVLLVNDEVKPSPAAARLFLLEVHTLGKFVSI
ncbi:unnamed protein product [Dicrocoelium dendriticum]|nr:unnamed protein product [Dicrocoelium dendriticum]